jgi:hypothetical protein
MWKKSRELQNNPFPASQCFRQLIDHEQNVGLIARRFVCDFGWVWR